MQTTRSRLIFTLFLFIFLIVLTSCKDNEPEGIQLQLNTNEVTFGILGGRKDIFVTSNTSWTLENSSDWCTASLHSGEGNARITLSVVANTQEEERSFSLQVFAGDLQEVVLISQAGQPVDSLPGIVYAIPPDSTNMRNITAVELSAEMKPGWNIGNSLEATGGETSWGNPLVSQRLIDSVKAAGFNTVRIPVAWSKFSDESTFTIETSWMNRVEEVVNYALNRDMYVIMNIHWDGGWMQPTYDDQDYVNHRLDVMWNQIATHFRDYGDHLLFAGTNEVMVDGDYGTPTVEYYTVQNSFNQTFINTVRSTGGRNAYRHLVVQGFNTNINYTVNFAVIPEDVTANRLFMEVHYYDPYNFTLNQNSSVTQWGAIATEPSLTETWANESYADAQFQKMKTRFVDKGIAVIVGEYGVISRTDVEGHEIFRKYYNEYITQSITAHYCIPVYWDNGYSGNHGFAIFDRTTGEQIEPELIRVITGVAR